MAAKLHTYQCKLQYDADGTPAFTDLSDVRMIAPPNVSKGDVETTHLESTSHYREWIAGWRDIGEIQFETFFHKTQYNTLLGFFNSETTYYWRVSMPLLSGESTGSILAFQGHVKATSFEPIRVSDEAFVATFTIRGTGAFSFTAGS